MTETRLPSDTYCLACGSQIDAATSTFGHARPKRGDFTVCIYCGHVMVFTRGKKLRDLNNAEIRKVAGDKRVLSIQKARTDLMKEHLH